MGKDTTNTPPPAEPVEEDDSAWGEALAASFGFNIRRGLPAERDKPKPKSVRKRKAPIKPD